MFNLTQTGKKNEDTRYFDVDFDHRRYKLQSFIDDLSIYLNTNINAYVNINGIDSAEVYDGVLYEQQIFTRQELKDYIIVSAEAYSIDNRIYFDLVVMDSERL